MRRKGLKTMIAAAAAITMVSGSVDVSAMGLRDVFNAKYYADSYADLKEAFGYDEEALYQHFLMFGISEGRSASPVLDIVKYREMYGDLDTAFGDNWDAYVQHYFEFGIAEQRVSGGVFDPLAYAAAYPDIQAAFGTDVNAIIEHFLTFGIAEGRTAGVTLTTPAGETVTGTDAAPAPAPAASSSADDSESSSSASAPAHVHNWCLVMDTAGCTSDGTGHYECFGGGVCDGTGAPGSTVEGEEVVPATGEHYLGDYEQDPSNPGQHYQKCVRPGCTYQTTSEACSGGTATCMAAAVCEKCGSSYGTTDPNGHRLTGEITSNATQHNGHCSICDQDVAPADHIWGDWEPVDLENHKHTCVVCGYEATATHDTTNNDSNTDKMCDDCGGHLVAECANEEDHTPAKAWDAVDVTVTWTDGDCSKGGTYKTTCTTCGYEITVTVVGQSHDYDTNYSEVMYADNVQGHGRKCKREGCRVLTDCAKCSGGTATCVESATCDTCGEKYGPVDPTNHNFGGAYIKSDNADTHYQACQNEGCSAHSEAEGCSGGTATCSAKATCDNCHQPYGSKLPHTDDNSDHKCDVCGAWMVDECEEGQHSPDKAWNDAGVSVTWTGNDCTNGGKYTATCTKCFREYEVTVPAQTHTGGTPYCDKKAECSICGTEYGDYASHSDTTGDKKCDKAKSDGDTCGAWTVDECSGDHSPKTHTNEEVTLTNSNDCTEGGTYSTTCTECGRTCTGTVTYTTHDYQSGTCTRCGVTE